MIKFDFPNIFYHLLFALSKRKVRNKSNPVYIVLNFNNLTGT